MFIVLYKRPDSYFDIPDDACGTEAQIDRIVNENRTKIEAEKKAKKRKHDLI